MRDTSTYVLQHKIRDYFLFDELRRDTKNIPSSLAFTVKYFHCYVLVPADTEDLILQNNPSKSFKTTQFSP